MYKVGRSTQNHPALIDRLLFSQNLLLITFSSVAFRIPATSRVVLLHLVSILQRWVEFPAHLVVVYVRDLTERVSR